VAAGCVVIDNTSRFRYDVNVPLIVPEVNAEKIAAYSETGIIANPNCSTIQMMVALKPIYDVAGIRRINVATYQAVSGAGRSAVEELARQSGALLNGRPLELKGPAKQIAFNAVPHIDDFQDNRYTREEMKMVWETRKILDDDTIAVNPTAVRIPVFFGHSEAIHLETERKISAQQVCDLLRGAPGVELLDGCETGAYPTAVTDSSGKDAVFVGRVREDISHPNGINLWVVSDNIRKGAALNSVQIAEILAKNYL
jgi:aspartate-semialdehyde dehydrogenase